MAMRQLIDIMPIARPTLQYKSMSDLLKGFRQYLEHEASTPVERIETNAALFLHDLCRFLELGEAQRQKVLGRSAVAFIEAELELQVKLPVVH